MAHDAEICVNRSGWDICAAAYMWEARKGDTVKTKEYETEACSLTRLQQACVALGIPYDPMDKEELRDSTINN